MEARLIRFGEIEIEGQRYEYDLVIECGEVRKRSKKPSKPYKAQFGHTPLSAEEAIPWGSDCLIIGTGVYGSLPVMDEVLAEAERRGLDLVVVKTEEACRLLADLLPEEINAILHVTC